MVEFDVCNGDADGLIARHQFRLAFPAAGEIRLVTGVKRDIRLCARVDAGPGDQVNVFDIAYDQNAQAVEAMLGAGVHVRYFDHHQATLLKVRRGLDAYIDTSADVCSSLLVDRYLSGRFRHWAIAASYGDNLLATADRLAAAAQLSVVAQAQLLELGESLNYNAYGDTMDDLRVAPDILAAAMAPYSSPFDFFDREPLLATIRRGYLDDLALAENAPAQVATSRIAIFELPDAAFARRVSGTFANRLARAHPQRAHLILNGDGHGGFTVSIRAPLDDPHGAEQVANSFAGGGGRAAAAGINHLAADELPRLERKMFEIFAAGREAGTR